MMVTAIPQHLEAEKAVLGSVLLDNQTMDEMGITLEPRDFTVHAHQLVWQAMRYMHEKDRVIDPVTLTEMLLVYKRLDEMGGVIYLNELMSTVPTATNASYYADIVRKRALHRRVKTVGQVIQQMAEEQRFEEEQLFQEIERLADSVRPQERGQLLHALDTKNDYFAHLQTKQTLISTGFQQFDDWIGGLGRGWLYILAARPSVGKTAKMLQLLRGIASQEQGACLVWSQEMTRNALYDRLLSSMANVSLSRFRRKEFTELERNIIQKSYEKLEKWPIYIAESQQVSMNDIRATARQIKRKQGRIAAIFVDYLTLLHIPQLPGMTRAQAIGEVTRKAKQIAMELDCVLIMLAQMNREGARVIKPSLEHLRESGDIEQDADVVEFLWNNPDDTNPGAGFLGARVVHSIIAKGRDIGVNEFRYAFKGWVQQFMEL